MRQTAKWIGVILLIVVSGYYAFGYLSSYIGWYGYQKWRHRVGTNNIEESKRRGVFIKELHYRVEGYSGDLAGFTPYIERGFTYGRHSAKETVPLSGSNYPYQLSFSYMPSAKFGVLVQEQDLKKFDSSNAVWGYMRQPFLSDTVTLDVGGENIPKGTAVIKVW